MSLGATLRPQKQRAHNRGRATIVPLGARAECTLLTPCCPRCTLCDALKVNAPYPAAHQLEHPASEPQPPGTVFLPLKLAAWQCDNGAVVKNKTTISTHTNK